MRLAGPVRIVVVLLTVGLTWILAGVMLGTQSGFPRIQQMLGGLDVISTSDPRPRKFKCGLPQSCPEKHFAFRVLSGAANVIGPKICLEDKIGWGVFPGPEAEDTRASLDFAGWNLSGVNGELLDAKSFDMWSGDVSELMKFLLPLHEGTLVFVASYDDPATKMTEDARKLFAELGSTSIKDVAFRDSWVFVGAKGVQDKSPFEQLIKNSKSSNKYEGWPEAVELEGCVPQRTHDLE